MAPPGALSNNSSQSSLLAEGIKSAMAVSVKAIAADDIIDAAKPHTNGHTNGKTNGHTNGHANGAAAPKPEINALTVLSPPVQFGGAFEKARAYKARIICELEDIDEAYFGRLNPERYFAYLADERLIHMPARGSPWDRVLKAAEFFGFQICDFARLVAGFVKNGEVVRDTILASCEMLLELGHEQAEALEPTFSTLYELGLLLARIVRFQDLFIASREITQDIDAMFGSFVHLVADIAVFYRRRINRISGNSVVVDFDAQFGGLIANVWEKREHLLEHIWAYKLSGRDMPLPLNVATLRGKLSSREGIKSLVYGRVAERKERAPGTCEWIQHDLVHFLKSEQSVFTITGNGGCGKSMIAAWVRERLETRLSGQQYNTLSFTFALDNPSKSTPVAFLKSLLSQLLEVSVGDVRLYEKLAAIFTTHTGYVEPKKLEAELWTALEAGLATLDRKQSKLVIIVDGLDEIDGSVGKAAELHKRLHAAIEKHKAVRAVVFSRPLSHLGGAGFKHLVITPEHVRDDIEDYLVDRLSRYAVYTAQKDQDREALLKVLVAKSKGNFLFAYLALQYLVTGVGFGDYLKTMSAMKADTSDMLEKLVDKINFKESDTKSLFAVLLTAQRPLAIEEMRDILSVNLPKRKLIEDEYDTLTFVSNMKGLVVAQKGVVRFKHSVIRTYFANHVCGDKIPTLKDAHGYVAKALLLLAKAKLPSAYEPSIDAADGKAVDQAFSAHQVLTYVVRYWVYHFRESPLLGKKGELVVNSELKEVFPESAFFAMLEWAMWQGKFGFAAAVEMHDLALRIRSACFGEKHRSVLQSLVVLGCLHRGRADVLKASEFFYRASTIGQLVLYKFSPFVVSCAHVFLTCTETIVFVERTTVATYRVEILRFVIEVCKGQHGPHSETVIRWLKVLAALYVQIKETYQAAIIYKEIREIIIIIHGAGSLQDQELIKDMAGMEVVLNKDIPEGGIRQYDELFFHACRDLDPSSETNITIVLARARVCEGHGKFLLAEKLYINLWRRICEICRHKATIELHVLKLTIALEYVRFLQRIKRTEEACNILICVWAEYEHHHCESETIIIRLKELAVLFRAFGLVSVSIEILKRVWFWFKERKLHDHEEAKSTTIIITEVVEEYTKTITETTTTTTVTEEITREIWETTYTRCRGGKADKGFFKSCLALVSLYIKLKKLLKAEEVLRKSLELTWKCILDLNAKLTFEGEFTSERILVALELALFYRRQRRFEKAEEIYVRIFRACLCLHADDVCLGRAAADLIAFYEEYHRHEKVVEIYVELLKHYRKHLGERHKLTVSILYKLAGVYMLLGRKEAYTYYIEIVTLFTKDGHCHHDAFEAAIIVLQYYHDEKRWSELQKLCVVLWETFIHHHHECTFSEALVLMIYEKYRFVLEFHIKAEFEVLYKLTIQYREVVTKVFGLAAEILVTALLALAELCERNEKHYHESITIYEEIITRKTTTTTVTETKVRTIRTRLSKLYVTIIVGGKTVTAETLERAIVICLEMYEHLKIQHGCWHEITLLHLKELIILYKKLGTKEAHASIVKLLQAAVLEIITTVTVSMSLYTAATILASIYVASGMVRHGQDLLRQLRALLLFPNFEGASHEHDITIKLGAKVGKVSFVFLIAFEQALLQPADGKRVVCEFSQLMADLLIETLLYEQYVAVMTTITETTNIEIVLEHAARLRCVWVARGRTGFVSVLDKKLFALFVARYGKHLGQHVGDSNAVFDLYVGLLFEMGDGPAADQASIDFALVACQAALAAVRRLMVGDKDLVRAHALAKCAFQFANSQKFYHRHDCVVYGYRLAELLAGVGVPAWKTADGTLREAMLGTSRGVLQFVLAAMRETKVDVVSLRFADLKALIRLLGDQRNYTELEHLLTSLWRSREVQRDWSPDVVLCIGSYLVDALFFAGHADRAIALCDTIYYNLRQSRGGVDPSALHFAKRLALLLERGKRVRDATRVHEDVVCDLDEHLGALNGKGAANERLRAAADAHLDGLRRCGWASRGEANRDRYERLKTYGNLTITWGEVGEKETKKEVVYVGPSEWVLVGVEADKEGKNAKGRKRDSMAPVKERWGCWEASPETAVVF